MANIDHSGHQIQGLYKELWHAYVPCEGERVYYFPEGHVEQLDAASIHHGLDHQQLSSFCLSAKILCKVMNVQLMAEPDTEEVYAVITLLPDHDQSEVTIPDPTLAQPSSCTVVRSVCKTLVGSHGRAPLDMCLSSSSLPTSMALKHHQLDILSVASHAVTTRTRFIVTYKPGSCRSLFIISINKYLEAQNRKIFVGMRFTMTFEDEEFAEIRLAGTVVGVADYEWKSIQVEWNNCKKSSTFLLPEKVSFWELEPPKRSVWSVYFRRIKELFCWACL
ncbi:hypothetical protein SSX86_011555 [Deinandra increscens subsp. villosa]|uniref:Auxin response factor domain-containing protein n=1 Tax=Deinandra increscens subsp. villosa TaxID=3103831 RepID=A0AAP0D891_9ASTR